MSGHSHFKTVKATKDANDAKKGKIFSKWARVITLAAKEKGGDLAINAQLKSVVEQAKRFNMPKENIERAIKKGTGELAGETLEEVSFEAFGPGGIAIIIEGITDNKNRTISEVKTTLGKFNGKMAGEGAVTWMFKRKGTISLHYEGENQDELELLIIEAGAQDIKKIDHGFEVYTNPEDLEKVKKTLEEKNLKLESTSLDWIPDEEVSVNDKEKESAKNLFEALDENDAVQNIYSNLKI